MLGFKLIKGNSMIRVKLLLTLSSVLALSSCLDIPFIPGI